ncbi:Mitochondrial import receptor subunit TOM22, partial [Eschrichtius robustus]|nr:Mitochondrial import receptor subunit TOM22 [Eschrichtius robustus]
MQGALVPSLLDETLSERLWGLTEMFPERVRSAAGATFDLSLFVAQKMYRFSRAALWVGTTSFMILVLPVVFETEKLQMEQQQQLQQRQTLSAWTGVVKMRALGLYRALHPSFSFPDTSRA